MFGSEGAPPDHLNTISQKELTGPAGGAIFAFGCRALRFDLYPFDAAFLSRCATRIINEVKDISRVVYDHASKPPGTIEWE